MGGTVKKGVSGRRSYYCSIPPVVAWKLWEKGSDERAISSVQRGPTARGGTLKRTRGKGGYEIEIVSKASWLLCRRKRLSKSKKEECPPVTLLYQERSPTEP